MDTVQKPWSNYTQFSELHKEAIFTEFCVIDGEPDLDMFKYLSGSDFSMSSFKKAK